MSKYKSSGKECQMPIWMNENFYAVFRMRCEKIAIFQFIEQFAIESVGRGHDRADQLSCICMLKSTLKTIKCVSS